AGHDALRRPADADPGHPGAPGERALLPHARRGPRRLGGPPGRRVPLHDAGEPDWTPGPLRPGRAGPGRAPDRRHALRELRPRGRAAAGSGAARAGSTGVVRPGPSGPRDPDLRAAVL